MDKEQDDKSVSQALVDEFIDDNAIEVQEK